MRKPDFKQARRLQFLLEVDSRFSSSADLIETTAHRAGRVQRCDQKDRTAIVKAKGISLPPSPKTPL